jgi:hypothetical protein
MLSSAIYVVKDGKIVPPIQPSLGKAMRTTTVATKRTTVQLRGLAALGWSLDIRVRGEVKESPLEGEHVRSRRRKARERAKPRAARKVLLHSRLQHLRLHLP